MRRLSGSSLKPPEAGNPRREKQMESAWTKEGPDEFGEVAFKRGDVVIEVLAPAGRLSPDGWQVRVLREDGSFEHYMRPKTSRKKALKLAEAITTLDWSL